MNENEPATTKSGRESAPKRAEPRTPRSIRFSDSEWAGIEKEARTRGMSAAELVRHTATSETSGKIAMEYAPFPPEIAAQVERIYRGVYLLSTLKRDEMNRAGRHDELEKVTGAARASQAAIRKRACESSA